MPTVANSTAGRLTGTRIPAATVARRYPRLWLAEREAARRLRTDEPLTICRNSHAKRAAILYACAAHPGAHLLCRRCVFDHIRRHSHELEHRCDECGSVVTDINGYHGRAYLAGTTVRDRRGNRGLVFADVAIIGLGLCYTCFPPGEAA